MSKKREFVVGCNKQGVLEHNKAFYKELKFSEEQIKELIEWDEDTLEEGYYTIDKSGINYHGQTKGNN